MQFRDFVCRTGYFAAIIIKSCKVMAYETSFALACAKKYNLQANRPYHHGKRARWTSKACSVLQTALLLPSWGMHSNSYFLLLKLFNTVLFVICCAEWISKSIVNMEERSDLFFFKPVWFYKADYCWPIVFMYWNGILVFSLG